MKKHLSILLVLMLLTTVVSVVSASASASEKTTQIYKFTFEDENAGTVLRTQDGDFVGEIVEWPEDSGNHCLRYELNDTTHKGAGGVHPYIWPLGIEDALLAQEDLGDSNSTLQLKVEYAYSGTIDSTHKPYMYPFILFNDTEENYADHTNYTFSSNEFHPGTFTWSEWDYGCPVEGLKNGGITFCDENTFFNGNYVYVDNIELAWVGEWTDVENALITYDNGTPCEESDINVILDPTATGTETTATATVTTRHDPSTLVLALGDVEGYEMWDEECPETVCVPLVATENGGIRTFVVDITYDPSVLSPSWMLGTEETSSQFLVTPEMIGEDTVRLTFSARGEMDVTDTGEIANLFFDVIGTAGDFSVISPFFPYPESNVDFYGEIASIEMAAGSVKVVATEPTVTEVEPTATATATEAEHIVTETQPGETIAYGDVNDDGAVNMKDVLIIRKYVAGITVDVDLVSADINGDGSVNMKDVLLMRKFLASLIDKLGA